MRKFITTNIGIKKILAAVYFTACFIFFSFFYKYHLYFIEQMQLFRFSWDYISEYFNKPSSISCLVGDFLTQFYYLKTGGAIILTASLALLWYLIDWTISNFLSWRYSCLLSLIAITFVTSLHFNMLYPLAATISLIIALAIFRLYLSISVLTKRVITGIILAPALYISVGFGFYIFILLILFYELKTKQKKVVVKWVYGFALIAIALVFPNSMRTQYFLTAKQARLYPISEITNLKPNFILETIFSLDYEWYSKNPEKTIELAQKTSLRNSYVSYYYNLASASINKLPENLLSFKQDGIAGMFIPFNNETNFMSLLFGNEFYYFIGDINSSQHYMLMANTFSPKCESSRIICRLIETNIINGEYAVAKKYIKILKETLFYKKWARQMEQYLYNEELCNKTNWISEKRAQRTTVDFIKPNKHNYIDFLYHLLDTRPDNQVALNYLLNICLLYKDIPSFYNALTKYNYTANYLPKLYQEALIVYFELLNDKKNKNTFQFSNQIIQRSKLFKERYHQTNGNGSYLSNEFGDTYWFYLNFGGLPK